MSCSALEFQHLYVANTLEPCRPTPNQVRGWLIHICRAPLSGFQNTLTDEGKTTSANHRTFDQFQLRNLGFGWPIAFWPAKSRFQCCSIPLDSSGKRKEFWDRTAKGTRHSGRKSVNILFSNQCQKCLSQGRSCRDLWMKSSTNAMPTQPVTPLR